MDASTRGRRNRANGATAERDVAKWLRPWFPDACRAVRNTNPDPGDIAETGPGLFWSVKNVQKEAVGAWMTELSEKRLGRLGLLVVRRKGHASPGEWWCWLELDELFLLMTDEQSSIVAAGVPVRLELRHVMPLLVAAGYALPVGSAVAS